MGLNLKKGLTALATGGASLIADELGKPGEAAEKASADLAARIQQGMTIQEAQQAIAQEQLQTGQASALGAFQGAEGALTGGLGEQQRLLQEAQGQFGTTAGLVDPALQSLQGTSTAAGRSSALQQILSDPNNATLFGELDRQRQNEASQLGIRRSGANLAAGEGQRFGMANQLLSGQEGAQQNLLQTGLGGQSALASILGQRAGAAGTGGANLASLMQGTGQLQQQGGINLANLTQQGAANQLNLLGQLGQAESAGTIGAANARSQLIGGLGGGALSLLGGFLG